MAKKQTILKLEYEPDKDMNGGLMLGIGGIILGYVITIFDTVVSQHSYALGLFIGISFMVLMMFDESVKKWKAKRC